MTSLTTTLTCEELRCRYPSKRCDQIRVLKRDGDFHRFCDFHRKKANLNQQRLEQRRRVANQPPQKRTRLLSSHQNPPLESDLSPENDPSKFDIESIAMSTFDAEDLDLDLLGDLLDLPEYHALGLDETQTALYMLDTDFSSTDLLESVQW